MMNHITSRRPREQQAQEKFEPVPTQTRSLKVGESLIVDGVKLVTREEDATLSNIALGETLLDEGPLPTTIFTTTMIEMPIVTELPKDMLGSRHLEVELKRSDSQIIHRIFKGCQDGPIPARLKNGRFIETYADVIRLFLEKAGGEA
jgi:hypothetical protein